MPTVHRSSRHLSGAMHDSIFANVQAWPRIRLDCTCNDAKAHSLGYQLLRTAVFPFSVTPQEMVFGAWAEQSS